MQISRRTFNGLAVASILGAGMARAESSEPPFRIGIVGSDNSHAIRFAELCNKTDSAGRRIEGAAVTHLWGVEDARNAEVAEAGAIPHVVEKAIDMIGHVDGIICVRRHGSHHLEDARPFLEAGLPVFVDKPLAASIEDAAALITLAQEKNLGFSSFSTLRYAAPNQAFVAQLEERAGQVHGGSVAGPCDPDSEYDGIFFYAIHSVEMMHAVFGFGVEAVTVTVAPNALIVVCTYPDGKTVTLELYRQIRGFHVTCYGSKATLYHEVDTGAAYYDGMQHIVRILQEGDWPLSPAELLEPVQILSAIQAGMETPGTAIPIHT